MPGVHVQVNTSGVLVFHKYKEISEFDKFLQLESYAVVLVFFLHAVLPQCRLCYDHIFSFCLYYMLVGKIVVIALLQCYIKQTNIYIYIRGIEIIYLNSSESSILNCINLYLMVYNFNRIFISVYSCVFQSEIKNLLRERKS